MMKPLVMSSIAALLSATPVAVRADDLSASVFHASNTLKPGRYVWEADAAAGPVAILISIPDQKMYVYRGDTMVAASAISTGKAGNDTPVGIFTILQKKAVHHSNLYDDAPMPFMQRLTWDGVAIHAGRNPGFPASHGCIRVPTAFAKKLFAATEMGATVEVTDLPVVDGMAAPLSDPETIAANKAAEQEFATFLASAD